MIELVARGPVSIRSETRIDRQDGHDSIYGRVTTSRYPVIEIDLEFEQGHVNLEGYSTQHSSVEEALGGFLPDEVDSVPDRREWDIEMWGEWWDWVQQAHRYQTERPHYSIIDCLDLFRGWPETDSDTLTRAIEEVSEGTELGDVEMSNLSDSDKTRLRGELRSLNEYLKGMIKANYST